MAETSVQLLASLRVFAASTWVFDNSNGFKPRPRAGGDKLDGVSDWLVPNSRAAPELCVALLPWRIQGPVRASARDRPAAATLFFR
jgi:hypothetical protein